MDTTTEVPVPRLIGIEGLGDLFRVLVSEGYQVIATSRRGTRPAATACSSSP
jgi:hypothetical protein